MSGNTEAIDSKIHINEEDGPDPAEKNMIQRSKGFQLVFKNNGPQWREF